MSWIQKLYNTYENCQSMIGSETDKRRVPLLPICHTTQKAHVEIVLDVKGNFKKGRSRVIAKDEARTIIPCTESSGGRTSGEAPHPLCDKLQYVAADYATYGGTKKPYFESYIRGLEGWCDSQFCHPKVAAVLRYVKKGNVTGDLISDQVLVAGRNRNLMEKWDKKKDQSTPAIFKVIAAQEDVFIRWQVEEPGDTETSVWKDRTIWESWIKYYSSTKQGKTLCYVTGKEQFAADQHPAKLRNDGDKAKLISSNDLSGFTFRGRFLGDKEAQKNNLPINQACGIGFEITQKAHNVLRWLISRQGYRRGDQAIVAWATSGKDIPDPTADALSLLGFNGLPSDDSPVVSTAQNLANKLRHKILGYSAELGDTTGIVVMGLDAATPGRMAITFYRELTSSDFLQRICEWHRSCSWIHTYAYNTDMKRHIRFVGAPAPGDIAEAAYGGRADEKVRKSTVERILPSIIDGKQIPRDIVESSVRRASNRIGMKRWEWEKTLSIACALYKKLKEKEGYDMALDTARKTRDYLFGRLIAIADCLESLALKKAQENRDTNAARYMQQFAERPNKTWRQIYLSLAPYMSRLGGATYYKKLIDEVMCKFDSIDEFNSDKPLSGEFLIGYHCQRSVLLEKKSKVLSDEEE